MANNLGMTSQLVLLGLGANLDHPALQIRTAWRLLSEYEGLEPISISPVYCTEPLGGPQGQPLFYNAAALIRSRSSPVNLLMTLHDIEAKLHRRREIHWGPRTIDLDILLLDNCVIETESLTVPHPRLVWRSFVLEPAAEIAPDMIVPRWNKTLLELRNLHRLNLILSGM